jgi:hypothetical protein
MEDAVWWFVVKGTQQQDYIVADFQLEFGCPKTDTTCIFNMSLRLGNIVSKFTIPFSSFETTTKTSSIYPTSSAKF